MSGGGDTMDSQEIGETIRSRRIELGLKQQQLADRAGISRATLIAYEHGIGLQVEALTKIANILGLKLDIRAIQDAEAQLRREKLDNEYAIPRSNSTGRDLTAPIPDPLKGKRYPTLEEVLKSNEVFY
jgi:transcriptional regulator with XRE-family HTH domain